MKSDTITEKNIEKTIMDALKKYSEKNMLVDMMFWKHAIITLSQKYSFQKEFNLALKKQRKTK